MTETLERKPLRAIDRVFGATNRDDITWIKTPLFCPNCGKRDMWQRSDDGADYYHDCSATCHSCESDMCCVAKIGE